MRLAISRGSSYWRFVRDCMFSFGTFVLNLHPAGIEAIWFFAGVAL